MGKRRKRKDAKDAKNAQRLGWGCSSKKEQGTHAAPCSFLYRLNPSSSLRVLCVLCVFAFPSLCMFQWRKSRGFGAKEKTQTVREDHLGPYLVRFHRPLPLHVPHSELCFQSRTLATGGDLSAEEPNPLDLRSGSSKPAIPNCFSIGAAGGRVNGRERLLYTSTFYVEVSSIDARLTSIAGMRL